MEKKNEEGKKEKLNLRFIKNEHTESLDKELLDSISSHHNFTKEKLEEIRKKMIRI
jgi:hypothetical protein